LQEHCKTAIDECSGRERERERVRGERQMERGEGKEGKQ